MKTDKDYAKILGCLYGQAIGDALGMPSELWTQNHVRAFFGVIDDFLPGPQENIAAATFSAGQFTDDTQQAIALINAIIVCEGQIKTQVIAHYILDWAETTQAFSHNILGPTSKATLNAIKNGMVIEDIDANGVTNGAAMRAAPLGCLLSTQDRDHFISEVAQASYATHKSDIAIAGAAVISWAISQAIDGVAWALIKTELITLADEVQRRYESTFSPALSERIAYAFHVTNQLAQSSDEERLTQLYRKVGAGMDVIETVPVALAIVELVQGDPILAAFYSANLGGDTDTIGAIATAICGAISGIDAIAPYYINKINQANQVEFSDMAKQLCYYRSKRKQHE